MSSLAELPNLVGFFSYSQDDDEATSGALSALRRGIDRELRAQLGRSQRTFRLWQDLAAIAPGKLWESEIKAAVDESVFFIPIVTPWAVNSEYCNFEFQAFLAREKELGRNNLVFPILYISVPALEDEAKWRVHPVLSIIGQRQYVDWRALRHLDVQTTTVREQIELFCRYIVKALNEPSLSTEERQASERKTRAEEQRLREEAQWKRLAEEKYEEAKRQAEAERLRQETESAKQKQREEEEQRRRQEAELKRRAEEEEHQRVAEEKKQAEAERLRQEAEHAKQKQREEEERQQREQQARHGLSNAVGTEHDGSLFRRSTPEYWLHRVHVEQMLTPSDQPLVLISFASDDQKWVNDLRDYLDAKMDILRDKNGQPYHLWNYSDAKHGTRVGDEFPEIVAEKMWRCQAAILLLSRAYFRSDYCKQIELPFLLWRREHHKLMCLPIKIGTPSYDRVRIPEYQGVSRYIVLNELVDDRQAAEKFIESQYRTWDLARLRQEGKDWEIERRLAGVAHHIAEFLKANCFAVEVG
jgi:hypothetical protein